MRKWTWLAWALVGGLALWGCGDDDDDSTPVVDTDGGVGDVDGGEPEPDAGMMAGDTIVDVAAANEDFELLVEALGLTGLDETLRGEGPFTVFAPDDEAFEDLLAALEVESLSDVNVDVLELFLLYHVLPGEVRSDELPTDPPIADSVSGLTLWFGDSDGVTVNGVPVETADIDDASNGIIHRIGFVLAPPDVPTMAQIAGLSELSAALGEAGLAEALELGADGAPFTVFAPTNAAFEALYDALGVDDAAGVDDAVLDATLRYHVLAEQRATSDVLPPFPTTLGGPTVVIGSEGGVTVNAATVQIADINTFNGVIHVVDAVLEPPDLPTLAQLAGLDSLAAALADEGLVSALEAEGPFTVFGPTNEAFDALLTALGADEIADVDDTVLTNTLLYHVSSTGQVASGDIAEGITVLPTLSESLHGDDMTLLIQNDGSAITVNDAAVTQPDLFATNGVIHQVDTVMLRPRVVDMAGYAGLTTLASAIGDAADLPGDTPVADALQADGPYTVFAPTNEAFGAITVPSDPEVLRDVLLYHVSDVDPPLLSTELTAGSLATLNGADLQVTLSPVAIDGASSDPASVVVADVVVENGIIHVVDTVLLP